MRIAICAPYLEADLLEQRIRNAVPEENFSADEYYQIDALLNSSYLYTYDAVWIAYPGAVGLEALVAVREHNSEISIVWLSEDKNFAMFGAGHCLAMFLQPDSPPEDFRIAVRNSRPIRERKRL